MRMLGRLICLLWIAVALIPQDATGESEADAVALFKEAEKLRKQARTHEHLAAAVRKHEQALVIFEKLGSKKGVAAVHDAVGLVYMNWGRSAEALDHFNEALAIRRALGYGKGQAITLNNLGNMYRRQGLYDEAVRSYEQALSISGNLKDLRRKASTLANLGNVYRDWGWYDKAINLYQESLALTSETRDEGLQGTVLNNIGVVHMECGRYGEALRCYEGALDIRRRLEDRGGEATTLMNLGNLSRAYGRYDEALEYYDQSREVKRALKDLRGEAQALTNKGGIYHIWGRYADAVELYRQSLDLYEKLGDKRDKALVLNNLGVVFSNWGQYDKALELLETSLLLRRELSDARGEATTLVTMGRIRTHLGDYQTALRAYQRSLEKFTKMGIRTQLPQRRIIALHLDIGELAKAQSLLAKCAAEGATPADKLGIWSLAGRLALLKGDFPGARESYDLLRHAGEQSRSASSLFAALTGLGTACEGMGDDRRAAEYYQRAVELTEDLRSSLSQAQRENFFDVAIDGFYRTAPYEGLARVFIRLNRPLEAFKSSEYTKARVFAEAMSKRTPRASSDVPAKELKEEEEIDNELSAVKELRERAYEKNNTSSIASLESAIRSLAARRAAHIAMIRKQYPLYAATKYPEPMELAHAGMRDGELVVVYDVTDSGLITYLTKGNQLLTAQIASISRKDLESLVHAFMVHVDVQPDDSLVRKLASFDLSAGKKLADLLLGGVLPHLPERAHVIIVPDDCLGVLPFEMLALSDSGEVKTDKAIPYVAGATFFGDMHSVSYEQSVTALTLARTYHTVRSSPDKVLVMADPVFQMTDTRAREAQSSSKPAGAAAKSRTKLMSMAENGAFHPFRYPRLPLTGELAESLGRIYSGACDLYTGLRASKQNFFDTVAPRLQDYTDVVFATHGYFGKDLPGIMEPVLVLSLVPPGRDGYVLMSEIMGLKLNVDIVALTACRTGLGRRSAGEGTMGMGRAFQYAGARSVLMSLWSVSEESSVKLVESFFGYKKQGKSRAEALMLARCKIREYGFDHPFFWAPFILVGAPD